MRRSLSPEEARVLDALLEPADQEDGPVRLLINYRSIDLQESCEQEEQVADKRPLLADLRESGEIEFLPAKAWQMTV